MIDEKIPVAQSRTLEPIVAAIRRLTALSSEDVLCCRSDIV